MNTRSSVLSIAGYFKSVNWKLLLFLLLFLNVKLVIKIVALVIIYVLQPDFKFGFRFKGSRLPLFYPAAILIAIINWILFRGYTQANQSFVFLSAICFWAVCILAVHQVKIFTETTKPAVIYRTLILFFCINALFSFGEILRIILETGSLNPYRYQGNFQKYFISTGDYIQGISLDTSVTNAALNSFGIIFFLVNRHMVMVLLCMFVLLLTASNLTNLLLFAVLIFLFFFNTVREQKSIISICFFLLIVFLAKVSPQNNQYLDEVYARLTQHKIETVKTAPKLPLQAMPDSLLTTNERKEKVAMLYLDSIKKRLEEKSKIENNTAVLNTSFTETRPVIPEPNIHSQPFQSRNDTNKLRKTLIEFAQKNALPIQIKTVLPGKLIAIEQTIAFFKEHPARLITGTGAGNFSSKLAFKATALGLAGSFPQRFTYINPDFKANHLALYLSYFSDKAKLHSVINTPNSVYMQLLGEYGLLGLIAFALFYAGYFLKYCTAKGYGLPLVALLLGLFFTDYWFEQLSIVPVFEMLMFLNTKRQLLQYD